MKRGPRPIPTHLKLLRGNPGHRPINPDEPKPVVPDYCPKPPPFVSGYAAEEWARIGPELHRLGLLTLVDTAPLASYCMAYERWRIAEEIIARVAVGDHAMHGLLIKRDNSVAVNPLVVVSRKAANDMVRFASEFGLTPARAQQDLSGSGRRAATWKVHRSPCRLSALPRGASAHVRS
jgi:P27 family predicted phage terminase small subunit